MASCYNIHMGLSINEFRSLVEHIQVQYAGTKLARILEIAPGCVSLRFEAQVAEPVLIIAAHPKFASVFTAAEELFPLDSKQPQQVINASFPKALEHTISHSVLARAIMPRPDDRIMRLHFRVEDRYGASKTRLLQIELTGRLTHVFLLTEGELVISSFRRLHQPGTAEYKAATRQIAAGKPLPPPPPPPDGFEETPSVPLEVAMLREREAFAEFLERLPSSKPKQIDESAKRRTEAISRELELAREAKMALDMLGHFMLAPAGIRVMLKDAGCAKLAVSLEERGYLEEPIDFNQLMSYLQRISGSAQRLAGLVEKQPLEPVKARRSQPDNIQKAKPDPVSAKIKEFQHKVKRLRTLGGFDIIVTYSAEGNYAALKAFASPENLWFHARDFAGGYVIMLTGKRAPDPYDIQQAAVVAAANSKGRDEAAVEVCYTKLKYLRKPKGAKAGTILKTQETVISVRPSAFNELRMQLAAEK